uniref:Uncharacterized protein n=1 Tax=Odontella aurita TaxID=265563 RepID=A0A7S4MB94_9STRA|mmetsp:Transcript_1694/g.4526  ORF Transcript_1694/g.4526 Transcript_1694/m.4526 type:complete len:361 (+) Transcript_1694:48-1130(+)
MSARRRQRAYPVSPPLPVRPKFTEPDVSPLEDLSAAAEEIRAVDSILQHRQPPPSDISPATRGNILSRTGPVKDAMILSDNENVWAHIDIYGKKPPEREAFDERVKSVLREISSMPDNDIRSLVKAMDKNPFLLGSSPHIKIFLRADSFDPKRSAKRIACYWKQREARFGVSAFSDGVMGIPDFFDYIQLYEKSVKTLFDPEEDDIERALAQEHVLRVHQVKLDAVDRLVYRTPQMQKAEYLDARQRCPEVAASDEHKLQFLSCEDFVEGAAARRMLRYWKEKYDLFGPDMANRNITLDDLEDGGLSLEQGAVRLMPNTDASGRPIIVISCHLSRSRPAICMVSYADVHVVSKSEALRNH